MELGTSFVWGLVALTEEVPNARGAVVEEGAPRPLLAHPTLASRWTFHPYPLTPYQTIIKRESTACSVSVLFNSIILSNA